MSVPGLLVVIAVIVSAAYGIRRLLRLADRRMVRAWDRYVRSYDITPERPGPFDDYTEERFRQIVAEFERGAR
jgi:hypothetical protein